MSTKRSELQSDALGLLTTSALTAAYMAPALSIYALFGTMTGKVGKPVGFVMLLGMVMTLPSIISFGMLAREMPSAGGVYAWSRRALGESVGLWVGLATASYYTLTVIFPPIVFGQFFNELLELPLLAGVLDALGIEVGVWTWLFGAVLSLAITGYVTYRGIVISSKTAFTMLMTELAVVVALAFTFIGAALIHGTFSLEPVTPTAAKDGWSSIFLILPLAERHWGAFKWLVTLTGMTASIGALVPCSTAASRVLFAMGRDGKLPRWLGYVHPGTKAPWHALHVVFTVTAMAVIPPALVMGVPKTIGWWGNAFAWFIAVVYIAANVSNVVFYLRFRRERLHWLWNLIVPLIGMSAQCIVLWRVVIVELWNAGAPGRSSQAFIIVVALVSAAYVCRVRRRA